MVGIIAWFYLSDRPAHARWLTDEEKKVLTEKLEREAKGKDILHHASIRTVLFNGRVWMLALIYFGFIYGLYALAFFLPTIIAGFEAQYGTKFSVYQKGLITAIPYLPAAIVLYLWSRETRREDVAHCDSGCGRRSKHSPRFVYGFANGYQRRDYRHRVLDLAALPNFWTVPSRFLTGAAAAAGIALINTVGNIAGFAAGYITGTLKDLTGGYIAPMFCVGALMLLSAILMVAVSMKAKRTGGQEELSVHEV